MYALKFFMNTVTYTVLQKFCKILERVHSKIDILLQLYLFKMMEMDAPNGLVSYLKHFQKI